MELECAPVPKLVVECVLLNSGKHPMGHATHLKTRIRPTYGEYMRVSRTDRRPRYAPRRTRGVRQSWLGRCCIP